MKVGIDWGGTKIEGIVLEPTTGKELLRKRVDAPKDNYVEIINKVCELINDISDNFDDFSVGIGMPGSLHPETGLVQVSNTKALEGQNVKNDLENFNNVSIHSNHALVLISNGKATQREILSFANNIKDVVNETFNISLDIEPTVIN